MKRPLLIPPQNPLPEVVILPDKKKRITKEQRENAEEFMRLVREAREKREQEEREIQ